MTPVRPEILDELLLASERGDRLLYTPDNVEELLWYMAYMETVLRENESDLKLAASVIRDLQKESVAYEWGRREGFKEAKRKYDEQRMLT